MRETYGDVAFENNGGTSFCGVDGFLLRYRNVQPCACGAYIVDDDIRAFERIPFQYSCYII